MIFLEDKYWTLDYTQFDPKLEKTTEALCTIGNGYMGSRGAFEESISSETHYPGTYIAGVYNRLDSEIGGKTIDNEDLVNCPDWTAITFKIDNDPWFAIADGEVLDYHKQLNFKHGLLIRKIRFKDNKGRISTIESTRFVCMPDAHYCCIRYQVTPLNYSGKLTLRSALAGNIINEGVERYRQLNSLHLAHLESGHDDKGIYLQVETTESKIKIAEAAVHQLLLNGAPADRLEDNYNAEDRYVARECVLEVKENDCIQLDKLVSVYTSIDKEVADPAAAAKLAVESNPVFDDLLQAHKKEWDALWQKANVEIEGDEETARIIRFHSYHLLISASQHNLDIDASIPARGLHGEAYRGHIFWDDLFVLPFFNLHFPEIARSLIMYRYRRLDKARQNAKVEGYTGAMYPWQSGTDGREETQTLHLNPISGEWGDDYSRLQRHSSLAIAHDIWNYYIASDDIDFLSQNGAEMLFEIARFWVSLISYNEKTGRYEIHGVMGPDEFHEKQPGADTGGLKDNAYSNMMTVWLIKTCLQIRHILPRENLLQLEKKIGCTDKEYEQWRAITRKIHIAIKDDIISQFDGFLDLKELDWERYKKEYANIGRMDRILKAEGLSPDDYQLSKQADLLMLFYMLPFEEVKALCKELGYPMDKAMLKKNYEYYCARTSHGSTLSFIVHAHVAALMGEVSTALDWFNISLKADIEDVQGGTTKEGIHAGLMGGTIMLVLGAFAGLSTHGKTLSINPHLPEKWKKVAFTVSFRGVSYYLKVYSDRIIAKINDTKEETAEITVKGKEYQIGKEEVCIKYEKE
ncbi:MAG: glycoside hydrolase family 65 protein [Fibrobacteria bacterium]|nr:glycoside hydrolase family 65 protein [Fibrobacteria bacterium]